MTMYLVHSIIRLVVLSIFWPLTIVIKSYTNYSNYRALQKFKQQLRSAKTYKEWIATANKIDKFLGKDVWRKVYVSKKYDYRLIYHRIISLKDARDKGDVSRIISLFSSGLIRNFGGITDKNLFNNSYLGTKVLIHDYINEVLNCLEFVNQYNSSFYANKDLVNMKLQFFHNAKQTFGSTALILQGGSIFGMYHLGVIKTLYLNRVLPKIISGSYFGAVFACLICIICADDKANAKNGGNHILKFFDNFKEELIEFGKKDEKKLFDNTSETCIKLLLNFYRKSYTPEIYLLMKYVAYRLGDMTFEELYSKSGKILNVVIYSTDKSLPSIANYITSPNVIVWSAMYASIGSDTMGDDIRIMVKNLNNEVVLWNNFSEIIDDNEEDFTFVQTGKGGKKFGSETKQYKFLEPHKLYGNFEPPYERLTELFNVNHFIVSLARLYFKPLVMNDIRHDLHFVKPLHEIDKIIEEAKEKRNERAAKLVAGTPVLTRRNTGVSEKNGTKGDVVQKENGSNDEIAKTQDDRDFITGEDVGAGNVKSVGEAREDDKKERKTETGERRKDKNETKEREQEETENKLSLFERLCLNYPIEMWVLPITIVISFISNLISNITTLIATPSYTYNTVSKNLQRVVNMEIQYRFNLVSDLGFFRRNRVLQLLKKLTVDEKTPKLSSSEITIVPDIRDFVRNWRSLSILRDISEENLMESMDTAINFGEKSVWALLPILWVRCSIEFALDDLYNATKKMREV